MNSAVLNSSEGVSIHPSESSRSRLIKDIEFSFISEVFKRMDNKMCNGSLIHCRPHIPITPPKIVVAKEIPKVVVTKEKTDGTVKNNEGRKDEKKSVDSTTTKNVQENISKQDEKSDLVVPKIPGLSDKDQLKAKKSAEKKKKNATAKELKKKKKEEQFIKQKMVKDDFLTKGDSQTPFIADLNEFEFSDYSDDEHEVFEDSKEDISDGESLTPIQSSSAFGGREVHLSISTPNLSKKSTFKRSASSPDTTINSKKPKKKSLISLK